MVRDCSRSLVRLSITRFTYRFTAGAYHKVTFSVALGPPPTDVMVSFVSILKAS